MNIEKIRNLGPDELLHQQREAADQLFRLKFQLKMGQTTGLKKMRELRKDLARIKTISRERELGLSTVVGSATSGAAPKKTQEAASAEKPAVKASPAKGKSSAKKSSSKKKTSAAPKKSAAKK
ncbi:MAG: 50S ribosomal protein L29 [Acidobacteria bacterium]|nr:50S ribosomal protein L29 [Acidobacteriota bacterium]MBV9438342.1 50S ribosomal protein L29 [Acidobacteriota bacterium]